MAAKKRGARKTGRKRYGEAASKRVASAMRRKKRGTLRSGPGGKGGKVQSRKQAIAIGLSEARAKGGKVPRKRGAKSAGGRSGAKRKTAKRNTATRKTAKRGSKRARKRSG
jgi:hypothetical protein